MLSSARFVVVAAIAIAVTLDFQSVAAKDYIGGWIPESRKTQCVDICVGSKNAPTCFKNDPACKAKTNAPGDYDYLLLEQLFVPQFCRDLLQGVDSTVSHQNVNPAPDGIQCIPELVKSELTIHGLWPNYFNGYPACCPASKSIPNRPYAASEFATNQPELLTRMSKAWIDATQSNAYDTLCEIYNHEFQKHGICFAAFGNNYEKAAVNYFEATLAINDRLRAANQQINSWAQQAGKRETTLAKIKALYTKDVQVLCSSADGKNRFSAIRTCYAKPTASFSNATFTQIDCQPATKAGAFVPCSANAPISLLAYTPPASLE